MKNIGNFVVWACMVLSACSCDNDMRVDLEFVGDKNYPRKENPVHGWYDSLYEKYAIGDTLYVKKTGNESWIPANETENFAFGRRDTMIISSDRYGKVRTTIYAKAIYKWLIPEEAEGSNND